MVCDARALGVDRETARARAAAERLGIHMLMDEQVEIAGIRFLGATLWTDFAMFGTPEGSMRISAQAMNDFQYIHPIENGLRLRPEDTVAWHRASWAWLETTRATESDLTTVVVTHHLPHPRSVAPVYRQDSLTPAFCSDLTPLVEGCGAALWIHGHTHTRCDYVAGGTRVVCNPKGYGPTRRGGRVENPGFDPELVIDL